MPVSLNKMKQRPCIVITSIAGSHNAVLMQYAKQCLAHSAGFIVAGDVRSPVDFSLPGCEYLDIESQRKLPYKLAGLLPDHNYAKKNIAYLHAITRGYQIIIETDDDNLPLLSFWDPRTADITGDVVGEKKWVNVYRYFTHLPVWPRGFSLKHIRDNIPPIKNTGQTLFCPVQQGLVNGNPDVDAIFRLTMELPIHFKERRPVILGKESTCPFNSQNTTWFRQAFPLLYLPSYCSFRMTDIWRSFVAQRILRTCGWSLSFHNATAIQERNVHDLMNDFKDEVSGYLNNEKIVSDLDGLCLDNGEENLANNLRACYKMFCENKYLDARELLLLEAWLEDIERLNRVSA
jgi:hypothetical protein